VAAWKVSAIGVAHYSMSKLLGGWLVVQGVDCMGCGDVDCIRQWFHGGWDWQSQCVRVVVWLAEYQVVGMSNSHDPLKPLA